METFLAGSVPDLVAEHAILEKAFLCEERGADCRLFVSLEFFGDLCDSRFMMSEEAPVVERGWKRYVQSGGRWKICPRQLRLRE